MNENILYDIEFKADILYPNEGTILENCKIIYTSHNLYICFLNKYNLIIIIPKIFLPDDYEIKKKFYKYYLFR